MIVVHILMVEVARMVEVLLQELPLQKREFVTCAKEHVIVFVPSVMVKGAKGE